MSARTTWKCKILVPKEIEVEVSAVDEEEARRQIRIEYPEVFFISSITWKDYDEERDRNARERYG